MEELQPPLLLGEDGYTITVRLLTAKATQGSRSIRAPVIIYREEKPAYPVKFRRCSQQLH